MHTLRLLHERDSSGVLAARGEVDGTAVIAFANDGTTMGGAMGTDGCRHIVDSIDTAVRERAPVIGLWHSGGARLHEGVVALDAESSTELLAVWLNELIFRCETRHRLYTRFDVRVVDDGLSLEAEIAGEPIDRDRHVLDHEVKAVTRHGLSLERDGQEWVAELILDI